MTHDTYEDAEKGYGMAMIYRRILYWDGASIFFSMGGLGAGWVWI